MQPDSHHAPPPAAAAAAAAAAAGALGAKRELTTSLGRLDIPALQVNPHLR